MMHTRRLTRACDLLLGRGENRVARSKHTKGGGYPMWEVQASNIPISAPFHTAAARQGSRYMRRAAGIALLRSPPGSRRTPSAAGRGLRAALKGVHRVDGRPALARGRSMEAFARAVPCSSLSVTTASIPPSRSIANRRPC